MKFHIQIAHERIVDYSMSELCPFFNNDPLKAKIENLVCEISQKVFKPEPSYQNFSLLIGAEE